MAQTFKEAFCEAFSCSSEQYEERVFWQSIYLHAKVPALLLWGRRATFFKEDLDLLREVANVDCHEVFRMEINRFFGRNRREGSWVRRGFGIRISGKKLMRLKNRLGCFQENQAPASTDAPAVGI
jgi:hypothetical protein